MQRNVEGILEQDSCFFFCRRTYTLSGGHCSTFFFLERFFSRFDGFDLFFYLFLFVLYFSFFGTRYCGVMVLTRRWSFAVFTVQ